MLAAMSDLIRAVHIHEEIKNIVGASRQINLVALNALLTARQAGVGALGFSVVARELRTLVVRIESAMSELEQVIHALSGSLAENLKHKRVLAYMSQTASGCGAVHPALSKALAAVSHHHTKLDTIVSNDWMQLSSHIGQALQLSGLGDALARNAKVEAAHGGTMAPVLTQVACRIEDAIGQISDRLRSIQRLTRS
jgi:hypothetical protein